MAKRKKRSLVSTDKLRTYLHNLKTKISEEREKGERKLIHLGQMEAYTDWAINACDYIDCRGVEIDQVRLLGAEVATDKLCKGFDDFYELSNDLSQVITQQRLYYTTAGSAIYTSITGSSYYSEAVVDNLSSQITSGYENLRDQDNTTDEVTRMLGWVSEEAASKFKAAWDAFHLGIPLTDPNSGPGFLMRSALDITVRTGLLPRTPKPHPEEKCKYIIHIAKHLAESAEAEALLLSHSGSYADLTNRFSKVKGVTDFDPRQMRNLLFEAQDLLYIVLNAIDLDRMLPKKK